MEKRSSTWDSVLSNFRPIIIAQGEVAYAYNLLQESFFSAFMFATAVERPPDRQHVEFYSHSLALWHVMQNDRQQRQLTIAALESLPTKLDIKGGIERLDWAKKKADRLADYRNLIVHTPLSYWPQSAVVGGYLQAKRLIMIPRFGGISTKPSNLTKLRQIKSVRFWKALRNDLLNLKDYVDFVVRQLWWRDYERRNGPVVGAHRAWPRKPRLPCVRRIDRLEGRQTKPRRSQSRRGRRRTSPGR